MPYPDAVMDQADPFADIPSDQGDPFADIPIGNDPPVESSEFGALGRNAVRSVVPAAGAAAGFMAGAQVGAPFAPATYGLAPLVTGGIGAILGGLATKKVQDVVVETADPTGEPGRIAQEQADQEQHPVMSAAGRLLAQIPSFQVAPGAILQGVPSIAKMARGLATTEIEREAAMGAAANLGAQAGLTVLPPVVTEGRLPSLGEVGEAAAGALLLGNPRRAFQPSLKSEPLVSLSEEPIVPETPPIAGEQINANPIEVPVENVRSETPGPTAQVAEGILGEVQPTTTPSETVQTQESVPTGEEVNSPEQYYRKRKSTVSATGKTKYGENEAPYYEEGKAYLPKRSPEVKYSSLRHEEGHHIFRTMLTAEQRSDIQNVANDLPDGVYAELAGVPKGSLRIGLDPGNELFAAYVAAIHGPDHQYSRDTFEGTGLNEIWDTLPFSYQKAVVEKGNSRPPKPPPTPEPTPAPSTGPTGIADAVVEQERASRGATPLDAPGVRTDETVRAEADAIEKENRNAADMLVQERLKNPSHLRDFEVELLIRERARLNADLNKAIAAQDQGWANIVSNKLTEMDKMVGHGGAGTQQARDFRYRRMLIDDQYSTSYMVNKWKASHGFDDPPVAVLEKIKATADKYKAASDAWLAAELAGKTKVQTDAVDQVINEETVGGATKPTVTPAVASLAERIVLALEKKAEKSRENIKGKLFSITDPELIYDLTVISASHIARGALDIGTFTKRIVDDLGPKIIPHIKQFFDAGNKMLDENIASKAKVPKEQVRKAMDKTDATAAIESATGKIKAKLAGGDREAIHMSVRALVKAMHQADPKIKREDLINAIHDILTSVDPKITRLQAMDAITGRGIFQLPNQAEWAKAQADNIEQIRLLGHQEDVKAGIPPPHTGRQRYKSSVEARAEKKKLNDLMRENNVSATDPAAQLAGALQVRKTRVKQRMEDLRAEIAAKELAVQKKHLPPTDPELEAMQAELKKVVEEHEAMFPTDRTLNDEQRAKIAKSAAEKSEELWTTRLEQAKKGNLWTGKKASKPFTNAEILAIRTRRDAIRAEAEELRDLANPKKTPEERRLAALKSRLLAKRARLQEQMLTKNFAPKAKPVPVKLDPEATRLKYELSKIEQQAKKMQADWEWEKKSLPAKAFATTRKVFNTIQDLKLGFDDSAIGRQGGSLTKSRPLLARNAFKKHIQAAFGGEKKQFEIYEELRARPVFEEALNSKLEMSGLDETLHPGEEAIRSSWSKNIPGLGMSQRAFTTYLDVLRLDTFEHLSSALKKQGQGTPEQLKAIADFINVSTGKGTIPFANWQGTHRALADIFLAPRWTISRFQYALGTPLKGGDKYTRKLIAGEYARYFMAKQLIRALTVMAGGSALQLAITKSDNEKLKFGKMRIDPTSGTATAKRALIRSAMAILGFGEDGEKQTLGQIMGNLFRSKLGLAPQLIAELGTGKNAIGEKITRGEAIADYILPVSLGAKDITEAWKEMGIVPAMGAGAASFIGESVNTYKDANPKKLGFRTY